MDFSKIKMVVTDMDGTLLNSKHEVSDRFFELFEKLDYFGIHFVAASGRQYHSMADKLENIKNRIVFVAENGAYVKRKDQILLTTPIEKNQVAQVLSLVSHIEDAHPVLCTQKNAFVSGSSDTFLNLLREYYHQFEVVDDPLDTTDEILKVAVYHFKNSEKYIYPAVKSLEGNLLVKVSGSNWLDISHPNANKGYALRQLMTDYGVKPEELVVFGDYNNDLEMLQLSEFSFAMANAHPNVKLVAKYSTSDNDSYGVEKVLQKIVASFS